MYIDVNELELNVATAKTRSVSLDVRQRSNQKKANDLPDIAKCQCL